MNAPFLILVLGGILALAGFILRGRAAPASWIAGIGAVLLGAVALGVVLGEPFQVLGFGVKLEPAWSVLGRSLVLSPANRVAIGFVFITGALPLAGSYAADAPRRLGSIGLLILVLLAAARGVRDLLEGDASLLWAFVVLLIGFLLLRGST